MRLTLISLLLIAGNFISAQVEVSEINYNSDSTLNSGNWVELHNKGNTNINLTGWIITDSKPTHIFTFPLNQNLAPGEYLVVTDDTIKFKNIHPAVTNFIGEVPFGLSNNSDTITIYDNNGTIVYNMAYWDSSPWQKTADGMGRTLELRNSAADPALPESWFAGCIGGSPGLAYSPCDDPIVVTEINYHSLPQLDSRDWAELHNRTLSAIDISGWQLKDKTDTNFYIFPTGSIIPADGYLVAVTDTPFFKSIYPTVTNFVGDIGFHFSNSGDGIRLFNAQTGRIQFSLIYNDKAPWPTAPDGQGYTLELIDENGIVNDADNWRAGCMGGSPGRAYDPNCGTGISERTTAIHFAIIENPVRERLLIDMDGPSTSNNKAQLFVTDIMGRKVAQSSLLKSGRNSILLHRLSAGLYFATLSDGGHQATQKFLIE